MLSNYCRLLSFIPSRASPSILSRVWGYDEVEVVNPNFPYIFLHFFKRRGLRPREGVGFAAALSQSRHRQRSRTTPEREYIRTAASLDYIIMRHHNTHSRKDLHTDRRRHDFIFVVITTFTANTHTNLPPVTPFKGNRNNKDHAGKLRPTAPPPQLRRIRGHLPRVEMRVVALLVAALAPPEVGPEVACQVFDWGEG